MGSRQTKLTRSDFKSLSGEGNPTQEDFKRALKSAIVDMIVGQAAKTLDRIDRTDYSEVFKDITHVDVGVEIDVSLMSNGE